MSFASGVFSLYATGNPVVTGTAISSTWANNTLTDIATGLSTCVLKDGTQTTTGSVPFAFGLSATTSITTPSTTFALVNATATTVNFAGAATTLNIGAANAAISLGSTTGATIGDNAATLTFKGSTMPISSFSAARPIVAADAGTMLLHPTSDNTGRTVTIPAEASINFPVGTTIAIMNQINTLTLAITTDTLLLAGTASTGSRTLAAGALATITKIASAYWVVTGVGVS